MVIILSPSKTISKISLKQDAIPTQPKFTEKAKLLVERMRNFSVDELQVLLEISPALARLNFERYMQWSPTFTNANSTPSLLSFKGDVYEGLSVGDFAIEDMDYAQSHLRILSGLYGTLRPLDLMQPYRLEMATKLEIGNIKNLYDYWQNTLTDYFNHLLKNDKENTLVNLASNEYSKVIDLKKLNAKVITPIFKEQKGNTYKTIAIQAKRARGLMTRFTIKNRIEKVEHLKTFNEEGYIYSPEQTKGSNWVFIR